MRFPVVVLMLVGTLTSALFSDTVVSEGDIWYYHKGLTPPPAEWNLPGFNPVDEDWLSGPTGIGYSDDDDATVLDDMQGVYVSVFVRTEFEVPEGSNLLWILRVRYDDSFVAYLDGEEVARRGLTGNPPPYDQLADADHEILAPTGFDESISLPPVDALLEPGTHVLAVQVHNATLDSSDLSFSAELVAAPFIVTSIDPAFSAVEGGATATILGQGFDEADLPIVRFGGIESPDVFFVSAQELQVEVPAATSPGIVDVVVEDSRGSVTLSAAFRYISPSQMGLAFTAGRFASAASYGDLFQEGTFEFWIRRGPAAGFFRTRAILSVAALDGSDAFALELRRFFGAGGLRWRAGSGDGSVVIDATIGIQEDQWHHVALTFSPAGRRIYVDGNFAGQDDYVLSLPEGTGLRLGRSFAGTDCFDGQIESVRVWLEERTEEDIRRTRFARLESAPGLESVWFLLEGGGQTSQHQGAFGSDLVLGETASPDEADPEWTALEDFPLVAVGAVEPSEGSIEGGEAVRIFGTGFNTDPPPVVRFAGVDATGVTVVSDWELGAVTPPGPGIQSVEVTVLARAGQATLPEAYTFRPANLVEAIEEGDLWDYYIALFEAPPADWATLDFVPVDFDWLQGPSGIGYGDDDDATDVSQMENAALTLYARTEFTLEGSPQDVEFLVLRIRYDDGFVAYLNGIEVARRFVAGQPPLFDEPSSDLHEIEGGAGTFDEEIDISFARDFLEPGVNVLAIEVHNATLDSSDLSMSAELDLATSGGTSRPLFLRGDTDRSGTLEITDPILTLRYLFIGDTITCEEAADTDDDGALNIGDPIYVLDFLFSGGGPPAAPYPDPGTDDDDDAMGCEA